MFSFPYHYESKSLNVLKLEPHLESCVTVFLSIVKVKVLKFERQVLIAPCFVCDMFSFPYHCESESLKALKVLKDKLWLQLVSSVTCRPFHTEMKVKIWMFWKTSCYYTLCLVKVFLSISLLNTTMSMLSCIYERDEII